MDEQALQAAFSAGDDACLSAAIALYGQPLLRYCHHILCDYHEAQDAVQATFIKAWSHRAGFRGGSLQAWLFRMAYTSSIDLLRPSRPPPTRTISARSSAPHCSPSPLRSAPWSSAG